MIRVGHGYDVHRLVPSRRLILGGVDIPNELGLLGHSDADVLLHALMDSMLGAIAMGDIGKHFPDSDPAFKGIASTELLKCVTKLAAEKGYHLGSCDCTIICQKPKLSPFIDQMRQNIADICGTDISCINVKATTEEGLGFTGEEKGIAAHSVCIMTK